MDVEGKSAIVSGAGSGIGRATALLLARKGAKVLLADIDASKGEEALREARQSEGTAEFIYLVGLYCMVSVTLNGFDVPVPEIGERA